MPGENRAWDRGRLRGWAGQFFQRVAGFFRKYRVSFPGLLCFQELIGFASLVVVFLGRPRFLGGVEGDVLGVRGDLWE